MYLIDKQDVTHLLHQLKTTSETMHHLLLVFRDIVKDAIALEILNGQSGSIERYSDLVKD